MLILYLLFAVIGSTVAWLPFVTPREADGPAYSGAKEGFMGEGEGPDRALLVGEPADAFDIRIQMLRSAKQTLDITYYTIKPDSTGSAFLGEVVLAADRGVKVRVLLDGKMNASGEMKRILGALEAHPNITCRLYNPIKVFQPWKWHATLHDKFIIADGQYLLLGGRNVCDRFFAPADYVGPVTQDWDLFVWGDTHAEGSVLQAAEAYMQRLWDAEDVQVVAAGNDGEAARQALVSKATAFEQANPAFYAKSLAEYERATLPTGKVTLIENPVHTGKKEPVVAKTLSALALDAESSVLIQSPYATASKPLLDALRAIDNSVDVSYLTNSLASSPNYFAYSNYHSQRKHFIDTGMDIHELQSRDSIHGKAILIDGHISVIGSLNMDDRSFYIDTETMLVVDSPALAQSLQAATRDHMDMSLLVSRDNAYISSGTVQALDVPLLKQAGMFIASILSRLVYFLM